MKIVWIVLTVLVFIGVQAYLFLRLRKLDRYLESRRSDVPEAANDDHGIYSGEDVIE